MTGFRQKLPLAICLQSHRHAEPNGSAIIAACLRQLGCESMRSFGESLPTAQSLRFHSFKMAKPSQAEPPAASTKEVFASQHGRGSRTRGRASGTDFRGKLSPAQSRRIHRFGLRKPLLAELTAAAITAACLRKRGRSSMTGSVQTVPPACCPQKMSHPSEPIAAAITAACLRQLGSESMTGSVQTVLPPPPPVVLRRCRTRRTRQSRLQRRSPQLACGSVEDRP